MAILKRGLMLIAFLNERWGIRVEMGKKMISINFWDCNFLYNIGSILALKILDVI